MADYTCPIELLEALADPFAAAAEDDEKMVLEPAVCRAFASAIDAALTGVRALAELCEAEGLLERVAPPAVAITPAPRPRGAIERGRLVALAAPLEPGGTVVAFPVPYAQPVAINEGGSAA